MAPVEPDLAISSDTWPLLLLGARISTILLLLSQVMVQLRRAARELPPSQETRAHVQVRRKTIGTFAALTAASLLVLSYHGAARYLHSLAAYARLVGEEWPDMPFYQQLTRPEAWPRDMMLGRWWDDVDLEKGYRDVAVGTARGLWWTQQQLLATVSWSAFLGIEGHRRYMSAWLILPLIALSQLCGLSVAQNLSFVALLLSRLPIRRARSTSRRHSSLWTPHPAVYVVPVLIATGCLFSMHTFVSSAYGKMVEYIILACQVWLGLAHEIIPLSWGTDGENKRGMHRTYTSLYRMIAGFTLAHYVYRTIVALYVNSPSSQSTKYNFVWNMQQGYERTAIEMIVFAADRVLNAISHEPVISAAGWDVLLSGFSLCIWAAVRSLNPSEMLNSIVPGKGNSGAEDETVTGSVPKMLPTRRGRGRPRKNDAAAATTAGRRSMRHRAVTHDSDSDSYVPPAAVADEVASMEHEEEHGKEDVVEDLESVALTWGLALVGGLGLASAAVHGAELRCR
ncbi:hypothetical protein K490DRAFT_57224 [Saccharata proteae CBS 121410]|uniref:Uncharacterized protein n=1 Tax=Saccharata proteae CBS 121410 TaxID=1314787 RepID=A0A9P4HUN2_9PEZI|nr:hypothetical protein K490DRAFT_57224 [Saccharata proteae CBS 121410]